MDGGFQPQLPFSACHGATVAGGTRQEAPWETLMAERPLQPPLWCKGTRGRGRGLLCISTTGIRSQMVQNCSEFVQNGAKWSKTGQNCSKYDQNRPKSVEIGPKWSKSNQNGPKSVKIGRNGLKMFNIGPKWSQNGQNWSKMVRKWSKSVQNGLEMVKIESNLSKLV